MMMVTVDSGGMYMISSAARRATYADTISSQTFCGAAETMPGKPELQGGTRAVNSSLVMVQEVGWTRIDRS